MMERFSSLVTKSRPWPVIGRTIFFTSDKNRPTRDEIYFIDFWRENLSMYRIKLNTAHINTMIKSSFFMTLEQLIGLLSTALTMLTRPLIRGVQSTPALPTNTLQ